MADLVTKIRTNAGVSQIDYNALANLPDLDTMQTDLTNLQKKIDTKADSSDLQSAQTTLDSLKKDLDLKAYSTEVEALRTEVDTQFTALNFKYVAKSSFEAAGYVTESQLENVLTKSEDGTFSISSSVLDGYVTENSLDDKLFNEGYITRDNLAYDIENLGDDFVTEESEDGEVVLSVNLALEGLNNIRVVTASEIPNPPEEGCWYLVKVEE